MNINRPKQEEEKNYSTVLANVEVLINFVMLQILTPPLFNFLKHSEQIKRAHHRHRYLNLLTRATKIDETYFG